MSSPLLVLINSKKITNKYKMELIQHINRVFTNKISIEKPIEKEDPEEFYLYGLFSSDKLEGILDFLAADTNRTFYIVGQASSEKFIEYALFIKNYGFDISFVLDALEFQDSEMDRTTFKANLGQLSLNSAMFSSLVVPS